MAPTWDVPVLFVLQKALLKAAFHLEIRDDDVPAHSKSGYVPQACKNNS